MASNFQLFYLQNADSLHLQMHGDFDGTSAYELINTLKNQKRDYFSVFIDTSDLNIINTFGIEVFRKKLKMLVKNNRNLQFIGKHKHRFADI